jgi:hypothetical protein
MKIFSLPKEVSAPKPDYDNYDRAKVAADEAKHMADLKAFLKKAGYKGKYTGEIYKEGVADGYALYMVADGTPFGLVHLPYGDAYQARDVAWLPKKEILRRIEADKKLSALFTKKN